MSGTGSMSYFTEMLRTLQWGERNLGSDYIPQGTAQFTIDAFPPYSEISATLSPPSGIYAYLYYAAFFGDSMAPDAFEFEWEAWGSRVFGGALTPGLTGIDLNYYIPCTETKVIKYRLVNTTGLLQYVELNTAFLVIANENYYRDVVEALKQRATSAKLEEEVTACRKLLEDMKKTEGGRR